MMSRTRRVIQLIGRRASGQLGLPKRLPVFQTANSASLPFPIFDDDGPKRGWLSTGTSEKKENRVEGTL